jgi:hypothetical protein
MTTPNRPLAAMLLVTGAAGVAPGQLTTIPSRAAFNASYPGAPFENFEEARVDPGSALAMPPPLDSSTHNAIFHAGEIVAGLRLTVGSAPLTNNLVVTGAGFGGYPSKCIQYNYATTAVPQVTILFLNGNVKAFAIDVVSNPAGNSVSVAVYAGPTLLGTFGLNIVPASGRFFGVASAVAPITHVTLSSPSDFIGVDNVAFASAVGCYPDCNGDGSLTVADFGCFQTRFVAGHPYADCNGDGARTVADFGCFQTKFVAGCP